jgi:uncharacterized protein
MIGPDRSAWPDFPFCSSRCRLIDLGRWLGENYRVAADPDESGSTPSADNESEIP